MNGSARSAGALYRLLGAFTKVHPGEAGKALLLTLNIFLILTAYYILKPIREGLFLSSSSPELKSYLGAAQAVLFIFVVKAFARLASRVPRHVLITRVTGFFISNLLLFYVLHLAGLSGKVMGIAYFIWVGIFNLLAIAQFWAFANDLYTEDEGRRLFPMVAFGASVGGVAGSWLSESLAGSKSVFHMMLVAAGLLGVSIVFTRIIHARDIGRREECRAECAATKPVGPGGGFRLVWKSRYLVALAFFVLMLNFVNTNGQYILDRAVTPKAAEAAAGAQFQGPEAAEQKTAFSQQYLTRFYSGINLIQNLWTIIVQLFIVSRIFRWFGIRGGIFFLPVIALGGYTAVGLWASLILVGWVKAIENGTDYTIMNTTRHALFLITSREEKYKAKAAIDTFFHRSGDTLSALLVLANSAIGLSIKNLALANAGLAFLWILLGIRLFRLHKKKSEMEASGAA